MRYTLRSVGIATILCVAPATADPLPVLAWFDASAPEGGHGGPRQGVPDYLNVTEYEYHMRLGDAHFADDVERTSSLPIVGLDIGYWKETPGSFDLTLRIYENPGLYEPPPPPLLGEYFYSDLPGDGYHYPHLTFPEPLEAPANLWIGLTVHDAGDSVWFPYYFPPTLGMSYDFILIDSDGDGELDCLDTYQPVVDAIYLTVYSVPEPAALALLTWGVLLAARPAARSALSN